MKTNLKCVNNDCGMQFGGEPGSDCPSCGANAVPESGVSNEKTCSKCHGSGKHPMARGMGCDKCGGSGKPTYTRIKKEGVLGSINPHGVGVELRQALAKFNNGNMDRNDLVKEVERLMWKARTNDPNNFELLKTTLDRMKATNEGYGMGDMSKDPKKAFKGARWTVKFNEVTGDGAQTPPDKESIHKIISHLKPNTAVAFFSLTNPNTTLYIRKTGSGNFEVTDTAGGEYVLNIPRDKQKLDILVNQLSIKYRKYNTYKTFPTISSRPQNIPPEGYTTTMKKSELKEIVQELVQEMWVGFEENDEYDKMLANYSGETCPKCKEFHHSRGTSLRVLNPSNPTVYQCGKCGHKWNPSNEKSTITKMGDKSVLAKEEYPGDTWNPKSIIKTPKEVADLIFGLKEGEGITFMSDEQGRASDWQAVEKTAEGDEYVYKHFSFKDGGNKHYLELDEDVLNWAKEITKNPRLRYWVTHEVSDSKGNAYKKSSAYDRSGEDQSPGDYEMNGPDEPSWKELYEAKGMTSKEKLRSIIREAMDDIVQEHGEEDMSNPEESREVQIGKEILKLSQWAGTEKNQEAWDSVETLAQELLDLHKKRASQPKQQALKRSLQYKHGRPVDGM